MKHFSSVSAYYKFELKIIFYIRYVDNILWNTMHTEFQWMSKKLQKLIHLKWRQSSVQQQHENSRINMGVGVKTLQYNLLMMVEAFNILHTRIKS